MSLIKEPREKVDYTYVINMQLDRIAAIRSKKNVVRDEQPPFDIVGTNALWYLSHVEALYAILLPELRGNALKYLKLARNLLGIYGNIESLRKEREKVETDLKHPYTTPEEIEEAKRKLKEIKERIKELSKAKEEILKELPADVQENIRTVVFVYEKVFFIVDKALEEMLVKLNDAGLLLSGKKVRVSVAGK